MQVWLYANRIDADVFLSRTKATGPTPSVAEHPLVKTPQELNVPNGVVLSPERPALGFQDILEFPLVYLTRQKR